MTRLLNDYHMRLAGVKVLKENSNPRKNTVHLLQMVDDEQLDPVEILYMLANWLSDDEVADMLRSNGIPTLDGDEDGDEDDDE